MELLDEGLGENSAILIKNGNYNNSLILKKSSGICRWLSTSRKGNQPDIRSEWAS
jgi:hypothetical protein